ncbi:uncharacterized protein CLUP02_14492 [Colletotrichum lupini]|uniref:Uncharacterized protein n=1 Tax=Colletotrichum lupini TaxID=145971 RepID=A0A9Q8T4N6_9PEZI|nr:uncharacterized protein CLUP02_14492 [Colletotrichum lupini]UQC88965.1 hypothetical protein CLUP02_14492 [Colletotrichum lupini]
MNFLTLCLLILMRVYYAVIRWLRHIPIASNGIQNPRLKAYIGSIYLGEVRQRNLPPSLGYDYKPLSTTLHRDMRPGLLPYYSSDVLTHERNFDPELMSTGHESSTILLF